MDIRSLRAQAHHLQPLLHIGKAGIAQGVVDQLLLHLKAHHLVKVKLLAAALPEEPKKEDRQGLAQLLAESTDSQVVSVVGNIVVLYRR